MISSIKCDDGRYVYEHDQKAAVLWNSFKERPGVTLNPNISFHIEHLSTHHNLIHLENQFTAKEIDEVIKHMVVDKSPRPNGFNGLFMKKNVGIL